MLARCADYIDEHIGEILGEWEERALREVSSARDVPTLVLKNHLPVFLEALASAMRQKEHEISADDVSEIISLSSSKAHGKNRAATKEYNVSQVLQEYAILRQCLIETLKKNISVNEEIFEAVTRSIEVSSFAAAQEFTRQIDKMQAKILSTLAHDIRTPLSVAMLCFDFLAQQLKENRWQENLEMIEMGKRNFERASFMLEGILDTIRIGSGQGMHFSFEGGDYRQTVADAVDEASLLYPQTIEFVPSEKPLPAAFDETAVRRVIENLLSNAVKYGDLQRKITLTLKERQEEVEICVHNWGQPIPPKKQKKIFNFLYQTEPNLPSSKKGWGLGLTLVKLVARAHDGRVEVTSDKDSGTTFKVFLAKLPKAAASATAERI